MIGTSIWYFIICLPFFFFFLQLELNTGFPYLRRLTYIIWWKEIEYACPLLCTVVPVTSQFLPHHCPHVEKVISAYCHSLFCSQCCSPVGLKSPLSFSMHNPTSQISGPSLKTQVRNINST